MRFRVLALVTMLAQCKDPAPAAPDAGTSVRPTASTSSVAPVPTPTPTREAEIPPPPGDAGTGACKPLDGPTKLTRRGPYAVVSRMGFVDFYAQESGRPLLAGSVRVDPKPGAPTANAPPIAAPGEGRGRPACASAGTFVFCMDSAGEIRRFRLAADKAESDNFVARARPGGELAAALVSGHTLVAYLRDRITSEGNVTEAYVESDDGTETRLSEDGAGATSIALASHGANAAIALYVDARRGMSPVHSRTLSANAGKVTLGKDAVLFVGGSAETGTRVFLGARGPTAYALVPVAHDLAFGVATAKIDGEPITDAPIVWSDYPNGLDPAPVAATDDTTAPLVIARVRPSAAKFGSPRVLEVGTLDAANAFVSYGFVPTQGTPLDVAIASDGANGFVLGYTDAAGGFSERLVCEKK